VWWEQRRTPAGDRDTNLYRISVDGGSGQIDRQVRSERPVGPVTLTDLEEEPTKKNPTTHGRPAVARSRRRVEYTPDFEAWWDVYPRKEKKQTAFRAYIAARSTADHATLIQGARRYADDPNRDPAFTQHPATWLNNDGWLDEPLPPRTTRTSANDAVAQTLALANRLGQQSITGAGPWGQIGAGS
jgi:hypothetical protein